MWFLPILKHYEKLNGKQGREQRNKIYQNLPSCTLTFFLGIHFWLSCKFWNYLDPSLSNHLHHKLQDWISRNVSWEISGKSLLEASYFHHHRSCMISKRWHEGISEHSRRSFLLWNSLGHLSYYRPIRTPYSTRLTKLKLSLFFSSS